MKKINTLFYSLLVCIIGLVAIQSCKKNTSNNNNTSLDVALLNQSAPAYKVIAIDPLNYSIQKGETINADLDGTSFVFTKRDSLLTAKVPNLPAGTYALTLEKDGKTQTFDFEVLASAVIADVDQYISDHKVEMDVIFNDLKTYYDSLIANDIGDTVALRDDVRMLEDLYQQSYSDFQNASAADKTAYAHWFEANKAAYMDFIEVYNQPFQTTYLRNCIPTCQSKGMLCCVEACDAIDNQGSYYGAYLYLKYETCQLRSKAASYFSNTQLDFLSEMLTPTPIQAAQPLNALHATALGTASAHVMEETEKKNKPASIFDMFKNQIQFNDEDTTAIYIDLNVGTITANEQYGVYKTFSDGVNSFVNFYNTMNSQYNIPFSVGPGFASYSEETISMNGDLRIENITSAYVNLLYSGVDENTGEFKVVFESTTGADEGFDFDIVFDNGEVVLRKTVNGTIIVPPPLQWNGLPYANTTGPGACFSPLCECDIIVNTTGGRLPLTATFSGPTTGSSGNASFSPMISIGNNFFNNGFCTGTYVVQIYDSRDTLTATVVIP